jgi:hypothetical protein
VPVLRLARRTSISNLNLVAIVFVLDLLILRVKASTVSPVNCESCGSVAVKKCFLSHLQVLSRPFVSREKIQPLYERPNRILIISVYYFSCQNVFSKDK